MNHQEHLSSLSIGPKTLFSNLDPDALEQHSLSKNMAVRTSHGAIALNTGKFTGRSPEDRFIVKDALTENAVWWGPINKPFDAVAFQKLKKKVCAYLDGKDVYVRDAFAGAHPDYRMNVRVINEYPWSNQFAYNMFLRPSQDELAHFEHEWTIINAPGFLAHPDVDGTRQENFAILDFTDKTILIGGTGYTGEIKKGIFSALNFILPFEKDVLSMHCSANVGKDGDTAIFFGLSGTGKTTLSADPMRKLIGDDEHGWCNDDTIFNFEGGCYAKVIDLSPEKEPDIFNAIKPHAILENVVLNADGSVNFSDTSITQNTRVSYPIDHIENIQPGSLASNPKNIFFLTADAYGVLPPISKLTPAQAAYHFISGYTAKVAGTEEGVTEPKAVFSACFGAPFMPLHPTVYADMLAQKMKAANTNVWLINTGWSGGAYGVGKRMKLSYTRAMITAAMNGHLDAASYTEHQVFGLAMPTAVPGVPSELLNPVSTWKSEEDYDKTALVLAHKFIANFKEFADQASDDVRSAAPRVYSNAR
ncbi:MAG: Phosphoenolpyruvate carboxykinase (ATP) [Flavobacteriales bacterium UBA4585]|nr:MAG: Phosphoenolpyruvate carboxykinase (ATP) [Flavobacteriales bacterium UBA4585]